MRYIESEIQVLVEVWEEEPSIMIHVEVWIQEQLLENSVKSSLQEKSFVQSWTNYFFVYNT